MTGETASRPSTRTTSSSSSSRTQSQARSPIATQSSNSSSTLLAATISEDRRFHIRTSKLPLTRSHPNVLGRVRFRNSGGNLWILAHPTTSTATNSGLISKACPTGVPQLSGPAVVRPALPAPRLLPPLGARIQCNQGRRFKRQPLLRASGGAMCWKGSA